MGFYYFSPVRIGTIYYPRILFFHTPKWPEHKIIGIRTDFRRPGESEGAVVNAMNEGTCDRIVRTREEVVEVVF